MLANASSNAGWTCDEVDELVRHSRDCSSGNLTPDSCSVDVMLYQLGETGPHWYSRGIPHQTSQRERESSPYPSSWMLEI
ncbi:unnamed protein product [Boreogadus saida]